MYIGQVVLYEHELEMEVFIPGDQGPGKIFLTAQAVASRVSNSNDHGPAFHTAANTGTVSPYPYNEPRSHHVFPVAITANEKRSPSQLFTFLGSA
jgi:hypothetical protein